MNLSMLHGAQYVRLAPGAAEAIAPYLGSAPADIDELLLDLLDWPEEIRPVPRPARDGRLIAGDPVLLGASDAGILLARRSALDPSGSVLVTWTDVRDVQVLGVPRATPDTRVLCPPG